MKDPVQQSENYFRQMADASPVLIWTIDASGLSTYYNKTFLDFIGLNKDYDISDWEKIVHPEDIENSFSIINDAIAKHQSYSLECRLLRADGQWRWVLAHGNPYFNDNEFMGFVGSSIDITERKEAEVKIKESENRFRNLIEESTLASAVLEGPEWKLTLANKQMLEIWQKDSSIYGQKLLDFMPELVGQIFPDLLKKVYETGITYIGEDALVVLYRNGKLEQVYMDFSYKALRNYNGEVYAIFVAAEDVTEKYHIKKQLVESEQRFKNLVRDATTGIIVLLGKEMKVEIVNEAYCKLINITPEELLNENLFSIVPEAEEYYRPLVENVLFTGEPMQIYDSPYAVTVNDKLMEGFVHITFQPYRDTNKNIIGVMAILQDVTETVIARKKIEQSEKKFEAAIAAVEGIIWTNNADGEMQDDQPGWSELTGQCYEEYRGYGWATKVHPEDAQPTVNAWNEAVKHKRVFEFEHRLLTKEKGWRLFSVKAVPSFNEEGQIQQWVGVHTDISEQREIAHKIAASENQFSTLANNIQNLAWIADSAGEIFWYNQRWYEYTGTTMEEMKGWGWQKVHHPDYVDRIVEYVKQAWKINQPWSLTFSLKAADGTYRRFLTKATPVVNDEGEILRWIGTNTDIEEQQSFAEKLEATVKFRTKQLDEANQILNEKNIELGRMNKELQSFSFVASHDLQEPLRKIQTLASLIIDTEKNNLSEKGINYFNRMHAAAGRMQSLIEDLLTFSRLSISEVQFELTDINGLVNEINAELEERLVEKNAVIHASAVPKISIIPFQFKQLLQNLISNSIKFSKTDEAPRIFINAKMIDAKDINIKQPLMADKYYHITVADNGIGFNPEHAERIFEVFQRLHSIEEYKGTGIGLAIVKKVVDNHNGIVIAESQLGKGSVFNIYLPG